MKICRRPTFFNWLRLSDSIHHVMTLTSKTRYASFIQWISRTWNNNSLWVNGLFFSGCLAGDGVMLISLRLGLTLVILQGGEAIVNLINQDKTLTCYDHWLLQWRPRSPSSSTPSTTSPWRRAGMPSSPAWSTTWRDTRLVIKGGLWPSYSRLHPLLSWALSFKMMMEAFKKSVTFFILGSGLKIYLFFFGHLKKSVLAAQKSRNPLKTSRTQNSSKLQTHVKEWTE